MNDFSISEFQTLVQKVTALIKDKPLDNSLENELNSTFPANSELFKAIEAACHEGIRAGEMCQFEGGGIKYGRVIKPTPELQGCSIDLVEMSNIKGPHHRHPMGEIDMIMPQDAGAQFDNRGAGWLVYGPDSSHSPTVTHGKALVLYLLPEGAIEFTRRS